MGSQEGHGRALFSVTLCYGIQKYSLAYALQSPGQESPAATDLARWAGCDCGDPGAVADSASCEDTEHGAPVQRRQDIGRVT